MREDRGDMIREREREEEISDTGGERVSDIGGE
jgi:hypothetical protein